MSRSQLNTREQFAAVVCIIKTAKCQKLVYLLEKEIGQDLGYYFKFYTHGVFSRELAGDLDIMKSMQLLDIRYDERAEAFKITLGPEADRFLNKGLDPTKVDIGKIQRLSEKYSCLPAWKLEIASTAVYAQREEGLAGESICHRVAELKPKFSANDVYGVLVETQHID
jgi:hypothetical protein